MCVLLTCSPLFDGVLYNLNPFTNMYTIVYKTYKYMPFYWMAGIVVGVCL